MVSSSLRQSISSLLLQNPTPVSFHLSQLSDPFYRKGARHCWTCLSASHRYGVVVWSVMEASDRSRPVLRDLG